MPFEAVKPVSPLGYYRLLGEKTGLRVSPMVLGCMNFGDALKDVLGVCDKDNSFAMLDYYKSKGGNFLDTANNYQNGESEEWVGEWLTSRKCRDEMVIATKYTTGLYQHLDQTKVIQANFGGNNAKSMRISLETSLKRLQTNYIDIFYVHWWSYDTSIEDIMRYLHSLVVEGKVLYLGISDTPAWIVSRANAYARANALTEFSIYQGKWNAADRSFEREILPMCRAEGMAIAPWAPLGGGYFKTEEQFASEDRRGKDRKPTEVQLKLSKVLDGIAQRKGTVLTSVALAYVFHKAPYVFPICGGRSIKHLAQNIEAINLPLTREEIVEIDDAHPFDRGFPYTFLGPEITHDTITEPQQVWLNRQYAFIDAVKAQEPVPPRSA